MTLTEMVAAIRAELSDSETLEYWSREELNRAVQKAVQDLDRFFPLEAYKEYTIVLAVSAEAWTAALAAGTWVSLANKPIAYNTESVTDDTGATCTRDTDYTMDYISGKITHISGGKIGNGEVCAISYTKSKVALDVSALSIIRITSVEYPYGQVPQEMSTKDFFGDFLYLTGSGSDSQVAMTAGKHAVLHYLTQNTMPTDADDGSFPRHLDEIVVKGAVAYACMIRSIKYIHTASGNFDTASGYLTSAAALFATAVLKLEAAVTLLAAIDHTKLGTALDASNTSGDSAVSLIADATAMITTALGYLTSGAGVVNSINDGDAVAENYASFAARAAEAAVTKVRQAAESNAAASGYSLEAQNRANEMNVTLAQAQSYLNVAQGYFTEVTQYQGLAQVGLSIAAQDIVLSERFKAEGVDKRGEYLAVLSERAQLGGRVVATASVKQFK